MTFQNLINFYNEILETEKVLFSNYIDYFFKINNLHQK